MVQPCQENHCDNVVFLQETCLILTRWPLAKVTQIHPGKVGIIRVVTNKTHTLQLYVNTELLLLLLLSNLLSFVETIWSWTDIRSSHFILKWSSQSFILLLHCSCYEIRSLTVVENIVAWDRSTLYRIPSNPTVVSILF